MLHPSYTDLMKAVNGDVEEGETPYLLKKVVTPYSIDYNTDPAVNIYYTGREKVTYELHIPKGSIVGNFEFDAKN